MREKIEELIDEYQNKVYCLNALIVGTQDDTICARLKGKKEVYKSTITDLSRMLKDC